MPKSPGWIRIVFWLAALYDGVLGVAFLAAPAAIFDAFGVTPPNHAGYVQFPALLLVVFAVMFARVAMDPAGRRELMIYGVLLKLSYSGVVIGYWLTSGVPDLWLPMAGLDLVWAVAFAAAYMKTAGPRVRPGLAG